MTTTWRTTLGAALVLAALGVATPHGRAQVSGRTPPRQRPQSAPLPPLPVTQIDTRGGEAAQTFSLSFAEPQPIRDVVLMMVKDTGLSAAIDPDVTGTFTGELTNVTLKQALDITLPPLALQYTLADNVLHVFKRRTETRFFSVNYVATRRSGQRVTAAAAGVAVAPPAPATGATVTSTDATDFYEDLSRTIRTLLSPDGTFTIDRKAGLVQATDYPDRLDRISRYLELAEARATRQVDIQAMFVEVDLRDATGGGIDWPAVLRDAGEAAPSSRAAGNEPIGSGLVVRSPRDVLRALATQGAVNVLARQRVAAMNNEPAIVRAGTERAQPVAAEGARDREASGRRQREGAVSASASDGVVLTVTPQISADGMIQMSVTPAVASAGALAPRHGTPALAVRAADTVVRVHDGETIVIGGLMQAQPAPRATGERHGMAGVPILGGLFRRRAGDPPPPRKTELVILLTPTIGGR